MVSRKLKHYFQEHPITVVSSAPLGDVIQNREATGRIAKWAIELGSHHIQYTPRTAIKSQALVDFVNDWTELQAPEDRPDLTYWTIYFDGSRLRDGRLLLLVALGVERLAALFWTARLNSLAASEGESEEKSSTSLGFLGGVASFFANMPASV